MEIDVLDNSIRDISVKISSLLEEEEIPTHKAVCSLLLTLVSGLYLDVATIEEKAEEIKQIAKTQMEILYPYFDKAKEEAEEKQNLN